MLFIFGACKQKHPWHYSEPCCLQSADFFLFCFFTSDMILYICREWCWRELIKVRGWVEHSALWTNLCCSGLYHHKACVHLCYRGTRGRTGAFWKNTSYIQMFIHRLFSFFSVPFKGSLIQIFCSGWNFSFYLPIVWDSFVMLACQAYWKMHL